MMIYLQKVLEHKGWSLLIAFSFAVLFTLILAYVHLFLRRHMQTWTDKTKTRWDDLLTDLINHASIPLISVYVWYLTAQAFKVDDRILSLLKFLSVIALTIQTGIWIMQSLQSWKINRLNNKFKNNESQAAIQLIVSIAQALIILTLALVALANLNVDIKALLAGLGIGGIAVALAAQNILGDLFASFSIIFDKPFNIGDFIVVGNDNGTVEHIGLKTTRLRSLTGEQLIFSNKDLLESRIRNYKRMRERRVTQKIRVPLHTPPEKLENVPHQIESVFDGEKDARFEYCFFTEITDFAHVFELVFWISSADHRLYLDIQQRLFRKILSAFSEEKLSLATPVRTIHFDNDQPSDSSKLLMLSLSNGNRGEKEPDLRSKQVQN